MITFASYPGSIGEILQGKFKGMDVLISCPVNCITRVILYESNKPVYKYKYPKSREFLNIILKAWNYEKYEKNLDIVINSKIPIGKGFASSTADLCATYYALLKLFNRKFNQKELSQACIEVEPTDSIIFDKMTVFDYKRGTYSEILGKYVKMYLMVFEGNKVVDTVKFNRDKIKPLAHIDDLIEMVRKNSIKDIAFAATESIIRNSDRIKYDILPDLIKFKQLTGGIGIIGAHSGDLLAIVYEDLKSLNEAEKVPVKIHGYRMYKLETMKEDEIHECITN